MTMTKLTRLINADGEVVGYFSDYGVEMAARREWELCTQPTEEGLASGHSWSCRSVSIAIVAAELENVEPGDGDRVDYVGVWTCVPSDLCLEVTRQHCAKKQRIASASGFVVAPPLSRPSDF